MSRRRGKDGSEEALLGIDGSPRASFEDEKDSPNKFDQTTKPSKASVRFCRPSWSCLLISLILFIGVLGAISGSGYYVYKTEPKYGQSPPWYPTPKGGADKAWEESYRKAADMVRKMTLVEKVNVTTGTGWAQDFCVGTTGPAIEVGFPALCLQDGPLGIRFADHATAFPAGITVGATWNRDLMYRRGKAHALEARLKGVNVLLGPAMGPIGRFPAGGRNWEGFGSDPVLQAVAASETIKGIQSEGIIATAKHFVGNEQEHFRQAGEWGLPNAISSNIDDRTLHEIYSWPFAESIRAGVASIMCSYNQVNNSYACGNSKLMNGILKDELGFQGFIQSDWLAQKSGVGTTLAGLDMSMPGDGLLWAQGDSLWGEQLTIGVLNSSIPVERLDDMVTRVVASWYQLGQDDEKKFPGRPNFSSWTNEKVDRIYWGSDDNTTGIVNEFIDVQGKGKDFHGLIAREVAAEGTVLVKNEDNILPLSRNGASNEGNLLKQKKYRVGVFGEDAGPGKGPNYCADRGCNQGTLGSGWGSGAADFPYLITPLKALESAFDMKKVELTHHLTNTPDIKSKPSIVEDQDLCMVFINADAGEGYLNHDGIKGDRNDLYPQQGGDELVRMVAKDCGKGQGDVVVVIHAVGPVLVDKWIDIPNIKAVVLANLPGEESGNALADVLFGKVDASGRLPYTVGKALDDYGENAKVMYIPNGIVPQQDFKEGLYIDYRHFDKQGITPQYEFGFGLSYTTWSYSSLKLKTIKPKSPLPSPRPDSTISPPSYSTRIPDPSIALYPSNFRKLLRRVYPYISSTELVKPGQYPYPDGYFTSQPPSQAGGAQGGNPSLYDIHLTASLTLNNTGSRKGKEVVQLYVSFPSDVLEEGTNEKIDFPVKVLRAFEKIELEKGESKTVELSLTRKDLSYWSVRQQNWVMPDGEFTIRVGRSSRDLPLEAKW